MGAHVRHLINHQFAAPSWSNALDMKGSEMKKVEKKEVRMVEKKQERMK